MLWTVFGGTVTAAAVLVGTLLPDNIYKTALDAKKLIEDVAQAVREAKALGMCV